MYIYMVKMDQWTVVDAALVVDVAVFLKSIYMFISAFLLSLSLMRSFEVGDKNHNDKTIG